MKNLLVATSLAVLFIGSPVKANFSSPVPKTEALQLITQLPAELPQRVMGLAYDGEKLWATIYLGAGKYATFDPSSGLWEISRERKQHEAIGRTSGAFASPGAICFANGKLWVAGAYGDSFGSIDPAEWKIERLFKGKQREAEPGSQSYSSMACDGSHLWIVWHQFRYDVPVSLTQLLLKIDPETGKVVASYPAPGRSPSDGTHGLTWDGARLWHAKDKTLSSIDPNSGNITAQYILPQLDRPSGLAWDGQALWITEFRGRIWRLPF